MSNESTALTTKSEFKLFKQDANSVINAVKENLGNASLGRFDLQKVTVPSSGGSVWEVQTAEGIKAEQKIQGIIVKWHDARQYYEKSMDESGAGEFPDCASDDGVEGYGDPLGEGKKSQHDCAKCPRAEWGTGKKGRGQACQIKRVLYIVMKDKLIPVTLSAPATSYKNMKDYFLALLSDGFSYYDVITEFGLDQDKNEDGTKYSKIVPKKIKTLDDKEKKFIQDYVKSFNQ